MEFEFNKVKLFLELRSTSLNCVIFFVPNIFCFSLTQSVCLILTLQLHLFGCMFQVLNNNDNVRLFDYDDDDVNFLVVVYV